jgi:hypothetical protein
MQKCMEMSRERIVEAPHLIIAQTPLIECLLVFIESLRQLLDISRQSLLGTHPLGIADDTIPN